MPVVSKKRQVTLPIDQCDHAGIKPGDEYESFVSRKGHITIVTKHKGAAKGLLKGIPVNDNVSELESLESVMH